MRIVSLLPSASDIVAALRLSESLVGRTHECDWPPEIETVPVMTRDQLETASLPTREIHDAIQSSVHSGSSIYGLNVDDLREAAPDLILTQELCEVCAVSYTSVTEAARLLDADVKVLSLEPRGIDDILGHVQLVAEVAGVPERGERVVADLRRRLENVADKVRGQRRPSVASLEWLDPLFCAGHWVPEQVALGGGREVIGTAGEHSREVDWESVVSAHPEFLLLMPCGHSIERAQEDVPLLARRTGWNAIPAVEHGRVWALNGPAFFNRPGPRVVRGVEIVAGVLHGVFEVAASEGALVPPPLLLSQ